MAKVLDSQVSCLADMKDGDVAEILSWHSEDLRPGDVVQRYKDIIIPIGEPMSRDILLFSQLLYLLCVFPIKLKSYQKEH